MHQQATILRSNMRELKKSHLQARRELQELRRQVKDYLNQMFLPDLFSIMNPLEIVYDILTCTGKGP